MHRISYLYSNLKVPSTHGQVLSKVLYGHDREAPPRGPTIYPFRKSSIDRRVAPWHMLTYLDLELSITTAERFLDYFTAMKFIC